MKQLRNVVLGLSLQTLVFANLPNVLRLDESNFESSIEGNPLVLINCMYSFKLA